MDVVITIIIMDKWFDEYCNNYHLFCLVIGNTKTVHGSTQIWHTAIKYCVENCLMEQLRIY